MKLTDLILEKALVHVLEGKKTDDVIEESATLIDKYLDERFAGYSENLQRVIVNEILLPLSARLMQEDKTQFIVDMNVFKRNLIYGKE